MDRRFLAVAVLSLLVPSSAAQVVGDLQLAIEGVPTFVKPQIESPEFGAVVTAPCDAVLARIVPTAPQDGVPVIIEFEAESGIVITGASVVLIDPQECLAGAATATVRQPFQLNIPRTAPGLQALPVVAQAHMAPGPGSAAPLDSEPAPFMVTADYYAVNLVKVASRLKGCDAPCSVTFDLEVENFGNARTQYTFGLGTQPRGSGDVDLPPPLILDGPTADGGTTRGIATVKVHVGRGTGEAAYQVLLMPAAADDPTKAGNPLSVDVLVRDTSPLAKATPAPTPPLVGLLGLAAAAIARRRP